MFQLSSTEQQPHSGFSTWTSLERRSSAETNAKLINGSKCKAQLFCAEHENYTRGIDIKNTAEFSIWEFSGYKPYYFLYDFFIGNTSCIHAVCYSLKDSDAIRRENVAFWLTFIHSRLPVHEDGLVQARAKVVLIATHADEADCTRDGEGCLYHPGAARLLQDFQREFKYKLSILPELHVLDAYSPNTIEMKLLKQHLLKLRDEVVVEIPRAASITDTIAVHLEEWNRAQKAPIQYWPEFIQFVRSNLNPLCTETGLREAVQFLQYTGDLIVLETGEESDLIILNPSWVLSDAVGNLFCQRSIRHARITGSFTTDDLHFLISENDVPLVVRVLTALECCTICLVSVGDAPTPARALRRDSFFEDAAAGATSTLEMASNSPEELQLEIPRLNLLQKLDSVEWNRDEGRRRVGVQFRGAGAQLVHVFPRIQCRLRRAISKMREHEGLETPELVQWLHGSKLTFNGGMISVFFCCEETEQAIEVKLEAHDDLRLIAFSCFHDAVLLVHGALDEIVSQLPISHCLLTFPNPEVPLFPSNSLTSSTPSYLCKEVISQATLFQLLATSGVHDNFLLNSIFLGDPQLLKCCWFGPQIPATWIRYEVLLEICTTLGRQDGLSVEQLNQLQGILLGSSNMSGACDRLSNATAVEYTQLLNRLLRLLMTWRDESPTKRLGHLVAALEAVGLASIATLLQDGVSVFVLKDAEGELS